MSRLFHGNLLFFFAYDIGEEVNFDLVRSWSLLKIDEVARRSHFKSSLGPISFVMAAKQKARISSKLYDFGVLSFAYCQPFESTIDGLRKKTVEIQQQMSVKADRDAREIFQDILPAIRKPHFSNLKSSYLLVHIEPGESLLTPDELRAEHGEQLASLLRFESQDVSKTQQCDILYASDSCHGGDLVMADTNASLIYNGHCSEMVELCEWVNLERLELRHFDRLLEQKLISFYSQELFKVPLISFARAQRELLNSQLAKLRVDILILMERLESNLNLSSDCSLLKFHSMMVKRMFIQEQRDCLQRKLNIMTDAYLVSKSRLDMHRQKLLSIGIASLIAVEMIAAFMSIF